MKTSLICTVLNEQETVADLIHSIAKQSEYPDEVIIIDGGSSDHTIESINAAIKQLPHKTIKWVVASEKGNRAQGRNTAIEKATGEVILATDAGCILEKHWIKHMLKPFENHQVMVVAGNNQTYAKTIFQKNVATYVLVMQDKINPKTFLPSTRAIAFRKKIWVQLGGFPTEYSRNEDYVFAKRLKKMGVPITYCKEAIVYWIPPNTLVQVYEIFVRNSFGDIESKILRPKVVLLFLRYMLAFVLVIFTLVTSKYIFFFILFCIFLLYLLWAIEKNFRYVRAKEAFVLLPLLQLVADIGVMNGSMQGLFELLFQRKRSRDD